MGQEMAGTGHGLTDMQIEFVKHLSEGVKQGKAAELAGYASPDVQAVALVRHPAVQAELRKRRIDRINSVIAPLALKALEDTIADPKVGATAKFPYIKLGLTLAGHGQEANKDNDLLKKDLAEMTPAELAEVVQMARGARQAIEQRIRDITPGSARDDAPTIDGDAEQLSDDKGLEK